MKRRRERSSSTGAIGTASSQYAPKDDYSTSSGSTTSAGAAMVSGETMALDTVRGQINRFMPWSRSETIMTRTTMTVSLARERGLREYG